MTNNQMNNPELYKIIQEFQTSNTVSDNTNDLDNNESDFTFTSSSPLPTTQKDSNNDIIDDTTITTTITTTSSITSVEQPQDNNTNNPQSPIIQLPKPIIHSYASPPFKQPSFLNSAAVLNSPSYVSSTSNNINAAVNNAVASTTTCKNEQQFDLLSKNYLKIESLLTEILGVVSSSQSKITQLETEVKSLKDQLKEQQTQAQPQPQQTQVQVTSPAQQTQAPQPLVQQSPVQQSQPLFQHQNFPPQFHSGNVDPSQQQQQQQQQIHQQPQYTFLPPFQVNKNIPFAYGGQQPPQQQPIVQPQQQQPIQQQPPQQQQQQSNYSQNNGQFIRDAPPQFPQQQGMKVQPMQVPMNNSYISQLYPGQQPQQQIQQPPQQVQQPPQQQQQQQQQIQQPIRQAPSPSNNSNNAGSALHACPMCSLKFSESEINKHVETHFDEQPRQQSQQQPQQQQRSGGFYPIFQKK